MLTQFCMVAAMRHTYVGARDRVANVSCQCMKRFKCAASFQQG
jgi:hypothetical protein